MLTIFVFTSILLSLKWTFITQSSSSLQMAFCVLFLQSTFLPLAHPSQPLPPVHYRSSLTQPFLSEVPEPYWCSKWPRHVMSLAPHFSLQLSFLSLSVLDIQITCHWESISSKLLHLQIFCCPLHPPFYCRFIHYKLTPFLSTLNTASKYEFLSIFGWPKYLNLSHFDWWLCFHFASKSACLL